jgi:hypothetical protein
LDELAGTSGREEGEMEDEAEVLAAEGDIGGDGADELAAGRRMAIGGGG